MNQQDLPVEKLKKISSMHMGLKTLYRQYHQVKNISYLAISMPALALDILQETSGVELDGNMNLEKPMMLGKGYLVFYLYNRLWCVIPGSRRKKFIKRPGNILNQRKELH